MINILNNLTTLFSVLIILGVGVYLFLQMKKMAQNKNEKKTGKLSVVKYPDCPDLFEIIEENGKKMCKNTYKLGRCNNTNENNKISAFFDDDFFLNNMKGDYRKCLWSKDCEASWDGIERLC